MSASLSRFLSPLRHFVRATGLRAFSTPASPKYTALSLPPPKFKSPALELNRNEQKGQFYLATQDIAPGTLLLQEDPVYSLPFDSSAEGVPMASVDSLILQVLRTKELFDMLFYTHPLRPVMVPERYQQDYTHGHWSVAYGQVKTNAFRTPLPGGPPDLDVFLLFPRITLFNHSCWPNAAMVQVPEIKDGKPTRQLSGKVVTTTHILKGDEVCISYRPDILHLPRGQRQSRLQQEPWVFACLCPRCETPRAADSLLEDPAQLDSQALRAMNVDYGKLTYGDRERNIAWVDGSLKFLQQYPAHVAHYQRHTVREALLPALMHPAWLTGEAQGQAQDEAAVEARVQQVLSLLREQIRSHQLILPGMSAAKLPMLHNYMQLITWLAERKADGGVLQPAQKKALARQLDQELKPLDANWRQIMKLFEDSA